MALSTDIAANWPALNPLLDEVLELPPEKRTAWLAALPQEQWELRTALRALLADASGFASLPASGSPLLACASQRRHATGS
jgi:hypothetical protein